MGPSEYGIAGRVSYDRQGGEVDGVIEGDGLDEVEEDADWESRE